MKIRTKCFKLNFCRYYKDDSGVFFYFHLLKALNYTLSLLFIGSGNSRTCPWKNQGSFRRATHNTESTGSYCLDDGGCSHPREVMYAEAATGGYGDTSVTGVSCVSSVRGDASAGGSTTIAVSADRVLTSAHHNSLSFHQYKCLHNS